jgi:hypothetical protein
VLSTVPTLFVLNVQVADAQPLIWSWIDVMLENLGASEARAPIFETMTSQSVQVCRSSMVDLHSLNTCSSGTVARNFSSTRPV